MPNIVITNNGDPDLGDPVITYIDANGVEHLVQPGTCAGFETPPFLKITAAQE